MFIVETIVEFIIVFTKKFPKPIRLTVFQMTTPTTYNQRVVNFFPIPVKQEKREHGAKYIFLYLNNVEPNYTQFYFYKGKVRFIEGFKMRF